jgi:hypothetical protein
VFLGEGLPTALIGVSVWFLLTERPSVAMWLTPEQRAWLTAEIEQERREIELVHTHTILSAMVNPQVWALTVVFSDAIHVPHRTGAGRRPRVHQLDRQFLRLSRPNRGELCQGQHRELRGGDLRSGRRRRGLHSDGAWLRALDAAHGRAWGRARRRIGPLIHARDRLVPARPMTAMATRHSA